MKVFWPCFLWGTGTAIGEIPPYAITRAAKLAGQVHTYIYLYIYIHSHKNQYIRDYPIYNRCRFGLYIIL